MNKFKGFVAGFLVACLLLSGTWVKAEDIVKHIQVLINTINIELNGEQVAKAGESYTLTNGKEVPNSLVYEETTYVPIRKVSEILGKDVVWDGVTKTIKLSDPGYADVADQVIATIGHEKILVRELKIYLNQIVNQYEYMYGPSVWEQELEEGKTVEDYAKESAVNTMEIVNILYQIALKDGTSLAEEQLEGIDDKVIQAIDGYPNADKDGVTQAFMKAQVIKEMTSQIAYHKMIEAIAIDETTLQAKLEQNTQYTDIQQNGYTYYAEQVRARHILFSTADETGEPLSDEKKAEVKALAEEVLAKAKSGEDFQALVKEYSEDPGSMGAGGEYTFSRGQMVKPFEEAAFALKPGEISDLVETAYGYHIIKLEELLPPLDKDIEAVKNREKMIIEDVKNQLKEEGFKQQIEVLRQEYSVVMNEELLKTIKVREESVKE
ncbi:peptidylprolyl isomerase [Vallitalea pronyensis]|uniref:Peptidylprolyl isomerase n=1 Tax=Vallitalea pronyensis TaxID=1348613 RepID=A0A8J8SFF2_9FIRM|nr:peptidylprolyl isomerase [Vallitalea pronyensis]QUI21284.1 peptidylprolyl isomerase [Vallitalea pronyensis]